MLEHLTARTGRQRADQVALGQSLVQRQILATGIEEIGRAGRLAISGAAAQALDERHGGRELQIALQVLGPPLRGLQAKRHLRTAAVIGDHDQPLPARQVGAPQAVGGDLAELDVTVPGVLDHVRHPPIGGILAGQLDLQRGMGAAELGNAAGLITIDLNHDQGDQHAQRQQADNHAAGHQQSPRILPQCLQLAHVRYVRTGTGMQAAQGLCDGGRNGGHGIERAPAARRKGRGSVSMRGGGVGRCRTRSKKASMHDAFARTDSSVHISNLSGFYAASRWGG
ncbi:MAG: hypothetical protein RR704_16545 [Stenotrophomonas sp.]